MPAPRLGIGEAREDDLPDDAVARLRPPPHCDRVADARAHGVERRRTERDLVGRSGRATVDHGRPDRSSQRGKAPARDRVPGDL
jgi:hypothetical protein